MTSQMILTAILIAIIIKIDDLTIIGLNTSSPNKFNCENQHYQNSQKAKYQRQTSNTYTNQSINNPNKYRRTSNLQNNVQQPNQNFQNLRANKDTNQSLNCNKSSDTLETDSLLLTDVYGKKSSKENCPNYSDCSSTNCNNANDFSSIFKNLFQNSESSDNTTSEATMPDIETILKFKKIFERLNSKNSAKDPVVNLLLAVKPFMQESKKSIIDQLTKFMTISTALQDFSSFL